jgi:D-alanyl-D-alanine carboxypeptidase
MLKKIKDIDINYIDYGEGKDTVVLLHGWGQNIEMMKPIGDRLKNNFKVIIIDLPGFGLSDLIYGILLPSGAEAVQALAIEVFGSNDKLVEKMNEKAVELNLTNTHFVNPFGLDDDGHYSTVKDVALMLKYALKNDFFKEVYTSRKYLSSDKKVTLYSTIVSPLKMINNNASFIKGSKTGFTYDAGRCLASIAYDDENDINYMMITARAKNVVTYPVLDAVNSYQKIFDSFTKKILYKNGDTVTTVKTKYAKEKNIDVVTNESIELFYEIDNFDEAKLTYNIDVPKKITKILPSFQYFVPNHVVKQQYLYLHHNLYN